MQKIIGLDIGSYSIKAVEIVNNFKSYEISNFYENVIPPIDEIPPDVVIPTCMEQLFRENKIEADRIVTAMPGQYISSRVLQFAFSDARAISQAVLAEIEDAVPFNMDEMLVDSQILGENNGQTAALVVMTRKTFLASFLEHLQRINIDPKLVDVDSLAFYNLCPYLDIDEDQCYGIVDVGHEKTSVCLVQRGVLRMFRSINLGGRYITEFLARDLEVSFNEAQRRKHEISRVLSHADPGHDLTDEQRHIVDRMTTAANAIAKELGRTFYAFKTWEKTPVSKIFLSGGTANIRNFDAYLSDHLEIPVSINRLDRTGLHINPELTDRMVNMTQSIAIGMRAVTSIRRHSQINLRRGEFAYVQDYESVLKGASRLFKYVAIAMFLLSGSYLFKYYFYNKQITLIQEKFRNEYFTVFPEQRKNYRPNTMSFQSMRVNAKTKLTSQTQTLRDTAEAFVQLNADSGAMTAMQQISLKIPKEVKIDVTLYEYIGNGDGTGRVILKGETDGYKTVEAVLEAVKSVDVLEKVEEKAFGPKPGTDNKIIEFTIHADYIGNNLGGEPKA